MSKEAVQRRVVWVYPHAGGTESVFAGYGTRTMSNGDNTSIGSTFKLPDDFLTVVALYPWVIPRGTGNLSWTQRSTFAQNAEGHTTNDTTFPGAGQNVTPVVNNDNTQLWDASTILAGVNRLDTIGLRFTRRGDLANDTVEAAVQFLGWELIFNAVRGRGGPYDG